MLLSAFVILFITLVFSFFTLKNSKKRQLVNANFLYLIMLYFISCSFTLVSSSIYTAIVANYQSNIYIDMKLLFWILQLSISPWHISRIHNITIAFFMLICVINIIVIKKRSYFLYIPLIALIFVFLYINDYSTSWNIYMYINTNSPKLLKFIYNNISSINNFMLHTYMIIPIILLIKSSMNTKLKFRKKYYNVFMICVILIDIYYLLITNVFFKAITYSNISFSKLPIIRITTPVSSLSIITTFILTFGIAFIASYFPSGKVLIVSKKAHTLDAKNTSNNLNMILHTYKNAFISIERMAATIKENIESNNSEMLLACAKTLNNISAEQLTIINKTLSLTRIDDFVQKKVILPDIIKETISEMTIQSDIKVSFTSETSDISVSGDTYYLKEAFRNLIENAVTALNNTENIDKHIDIKCYLDNEFTITEFIDNGCGIKSGDIKKIFDLYSSSKPKKDCGGIGLYFVRNIINLHNGEIEVFSTPGESTVFTIILPKI